MGRPPLPVKRDQQLNIKLTRLEFDVVKSRANAFGRRPVDFGRAVLLSSERAPPAKHSPFGTVERAWVEQLRRVGLNLNQLVRHLHTFKEPVPPTLEPLLKDIRQLLERTRADDRSH
jgi:hypothetical protein